MLGAAESRKVGFELLDLWPHDVATMVDDPENGLIHPTANTPPLRGKVNKGY
jgi:hypothetical protein